MSTLRILGDEDVRAALDAETALDLARRTLRDQANGRSILSTPSAMMLNATALGGPKAQFKAASVGHLGASGIRLLSRHSRTGEAHNYCALFDHETAMLSGLVADRWLTRVRTAAFGAVSIQPLVNSGPLVVALFGSGGIAHEIVPLLARTLQIRELRVHSRRAESMSQFVAAHAPNVGFRMICEPDSARAAKDADVVITLTGSTTPLVLPGSLKPGAVLCSMGRDNEVDFGVLLEAQRLVVDDVDFAAVMGDGGAWISQGHLSRERFAERVDALSCEVIAGKKPGRLTPSDRIVALIQGMAIGDVAFAAYALNHAEGAGTGRVVELP